MRVSVPLRRAYKLINHGPTTLITSAAGGRRNVMSAAWVMALDFDPAKLVAVIAAGTFTRTLVTASGEFVVNVPTARLLDTSTPDKSRGGGGPFPLSLKTSSASIVGAPLLDDCAAWLECKVVPEAHMQERYDLCVADVLAAWADDTSFVDGVWRFPRDEDRTLHHLSSGVFVTSGDIVKAKP
jgi:flavin reductase (DIM6/NTAB) family NADH-FMN oxidoreductase RutF